MSPISPSPFRMSSQAILPILAFLLLSASGGKAGTWSTLPWKSDKDLPQVPPGMVTHALAFGLDTEPPVPAPFEVTKKISGENWSVWQAPEHTATVVVARCLESIVSHPNFTARGEGAALIRGRILPKGKNGWLTLELKGLEPGRPYRLALFGLALYTTGSAQVNVTSSDAPDQVATLSQRPNAMQYFVYEYTAPPDGELSLTFAGDGSNPEIRLIKLSAFLNYRVE